MLSKQTTQRYLFLIVCLTILTRFINIFWGNGFFFHPDENNMAISVANMTTDLNPHFFAYGPLPLYLAYCAIKILKLAQNLATAVYVLRLYSAFFSSISVLVLFHISRFFFKPKRSLMFTLLLVFCPGLIQTAHFGTTESLLILIFCLQIFLALKHLKEPKKIYFILSILVSSIGLASKISAFLLITPFLLSILFTAKKILPFLAKLTVYLLPSLLLALLISPYNLIAWPDFLSALNYEISVATGNLQVFYTRQFHQTTPYLFQFLKVFPFIAGLPVFALSLLSVPVLAKHINKKNRKNYLIVLIPSLIYFLYFGRLYVKWVRFMSPLFFLFPFLSIHLLSKMAFKLKTLLISLSILPGLCMVITYMKPDIRISFSRWFANNVPKESVVLSEAGNIINLPVFGQFQVVNFDFYDLDDNLPLQSKLAQVISQTDYIIVPSQRIYNSQNNPDYPQSQSYYQHLFDGSLGFVHIKDFYGSPLDYFDYMAEETWTVFDRPIIRLYQKQIDHNLNYYQSVLNEI